MRVPLIVFGSNGFVGKSITAAFSGNPDFNVTALSSADGDLADYSQALALKDRIRPGSVLVLAAAVTRDREDQLGGMLKNISIATNTVRLLEGAAQVVYISSVDVYGREGIIIPLSEHSPVNPSSYYAISKYASELILQRACADADIPLAVLRMPGVYGPGDTHMSPVRVFVERALEGGEMTVGGDGSQRRDLLYVEDVPRVVAAVAKRRISGTFNLVRGKSLTINQVLDLIEGLAGSRLRRAYDADNPDPLDLVFEPSKLLEHLPEFSFAKMEEGIRRTFEHYRDSGREARGSA